ncbi:MAG: S46 family peptidase [Planctomycetales bacterium]|nr:S46 family peptidase [Planctomycetales bacterium]
MRNWIWLLGLMGILTVNNDTYGDEGMWLFNQVPSAYLKEQHNFEPTAAWLDHLRLSSVRFNSGGSGSFVSSRGLVMTNHHVGADALQKMSSSERDLLASGYYANSEQEELPCVDLELNVLIQIRDVTDKVNAAVTKDMTPADAQVARRGVINTIESEAREATGLRSDVVTLYQGGQYHLYQFKRYTDVRLVFAPEQDIAFFGGDPDNFEYPRYCFDICFFRVYENGKPAQIEHFLKWSAAGVQDQELIFVSGHPGRTSRSLTVAHLEMIRDVVMPQTLDLLRRREVLLSTYAERALENERRAKDELFGIQNSRKARLGGLGGLQDPAIMVRKSEDEAKLRAIVSREPELRQECGGAWDDIVKTLTTLKQIRDEYNLFEYGSAFNTELFGIARALVRMADEDQKDNADRLPEFAAAGRESLEQRLFSAAPIYPDLETIKLADSLSLFLEKTGGKHPLNEIIMAGKSPRARAAELINGSTLSDVPERKRIAAAGVAGVQASNDTLIQLARAIDSYARNLRTRFDQQVDEPQRQAYAQLAKARFAALGTSVYPDATFTLRLAFGTVRGYDDGGTAAPAWTTLGGIYQHAEAHGSQAPFKLPARWLERRSAIKADTPFNFVSTADIIGGNSGSPVVNRNGEVVGIIFDGNLPSLVLDFAYSDDVARAISVDSRGIMEALRSIYQATDLADELGR